MTPVPLALQRDDVNYWHRDARRQRAQEYYERTASERDAFKERNRFYHRQLEEFCRFMVPRGSNVLEIGCGNGSLLAALEPSVGVGVDWSPAFIAQARAKYPHLRFFVDDAEALQLDAPRHRVLAGQIGRAHV